MSESERFAMEETISPIVESSRMANVSKELLDILTKSRSERSTSGR